MWQILSSLISGALNPILNTVQNIWTNKQTTDLEKFKVDGNVDTALIAAQVAVFQAQAELMKSKVIQWLYVGFAAPLMVHMWKVYIWDADFHMGTSDAVRGDVSMWAGTIIGFIFFHSALSDWGRKT